MFELETFWGVLLLAIGGCFLILVHESSNLPKSSCPFCESQEIPSQNECQRITIKVPSQLFCNSLQQFDVRSMFQVLEIDTATEVPGSGKFYSSSRGEVHLLCIITQVVAVSFSH